VIGIQLALATDRLTALVCGGWPPIDGPYDLMLELAGNATAAGTMSRPEARQYQTLYTGPLQEFDDRAAQAQITCPRMCLVGDEDDIYNSGVARRIITNRTTLETLGWDIVVLPGKDHMTALEPEVYVPAVATWLDATLTG
jgi:pimeloyl-ACP methyl ester carboxylesterase